MAIQNNAPYYSGDQEKFTLRLYPDLSKMLEETSAMVHLGKSDMLRELIRFAHSLVSDFYQRYPAGGSVFGTFKDILANHYDATQIAMLEEWRKERARMEDWQKARAAEGEKVNYRLNGRALDFYLGAWQRGKTGKELLDEYEAAEARAEANGRELPTLPAVEMAEPERLELDGDEPIEPVAVAKAEPVAVNPSWEDMELARKAILALLGVVLAMGLAIIGLWFWR